MFSWAQSYLHPANTGHVGIQPLKWTQSDFAHKSYSARYLGFLNDILSLFEHLLYPCLKTAEIGWHSAKSEYFVWRHLFFPNKIWKYCVMNTLCYSKWNKYHISHSSYLFLGVLLLLILHLLENMYKYWVGTGLLSRWLLYGKILIHI